ncbi:MAG: hypothetical protein NC131_08365 [Roseburia sp.]|nr:hypothetical protein [Roseburia sp.]
MTQERNDQAVVRPSLKTIFAAELFSKLSDEDQDIIIAQIEALLLHE